MRIINLFGGPGSGKSTTAAGVFYEMKRGGYNVELVTEYAKDMVWEGRSNILADQLYVLAKQHRRVARLEGRVDWVVTDSPFMLGLVYAPREYFKAFEPLVLEIWERYENVCFYLERDGLTYQEIGRNQDEAGAREIDDRLHRFLVSRRIPFTPVKSERAVEQVLGSVT